MFERNAPRRLGVVGGLCGPDGAERLIRHLQKAAGDRGNPPESLEILVENAADADPIVIYEALRRLEAQQVEQILLPSLSGHAFIDELQAEIRTPIADLIAALRNHLHALGIRRIGVLTSNEACLGPLFERRFAADHTLLYAASAQGASNLAEAARTLVAQGAQAVILADGAHWPHADALRAQGVPLIDLPALYADDALAHTPRPAAKPFKIGVIGGVGPAATVDFIDKIVRNTPACRDQDHVKLVVEQNPQIPDRTAHLIGKGADPTLALYAAAKKLEADEADVIAIPCNTAHAFVARLQAHLSIPIVNMLAETVEHIKGIPGRGRTIGLLATRGTVQSRVYHEALLPAGYELLVPDEENQARVMNAIYGPRGVKAGFTDGECAEDLLRALTSLVRRGAEILILGCTELPLLMAENDAFTVAGKTVVILDPTAILARACVRLSLASRAAASAPLSG